MPCYSLQFTLTRIMGKNAMKTQKPAKKRRAICQEKKEGKEEEEEEEKEAKAKLERVVPILLSRWRVSLATAPAGSGRPLSEAPTFLRQSRWHQIASGRGRQQQQQIKENARPPFEPFHFSESLLFFFASRWGTLQPSLPTRFLRYQRRKKYWRSSFSQTGMVQKQKVKCPKGRWKMWMTSWQQSISFASKNE